MDTTLTLAVRHLLEMLEERGEDTSMIRNAVAEKTAGGVEPDWTFLQQSVFEEWKTDQTQILFALTKPFMASVVKLYLKDLDQNLKEVFERPRILLISNEAPSPSLSTTLQQKDKQHQTVVPPEERPILQLFTLKELQYNPSRHILVPKHERLSDADVKPLLEKYSVKSKMHLPHLLKTDRMAKWLGLRVGDVVKIVRPNENSGIYHYYRCCV